MKQSLLSQHFTARKPNLASERTTRKRKLIEASQGKTSSPVPVKKPATRQSSRRAASMLMPEPVAIKPEATRASRVKALLTPASNIPELSSSTQAILSRLNARKPQKPISSLRGVMESVPAKDKYADLLNPIRELILPYEYKKLQRLFEATDQTLNYAKMRHCPTIFDNIKSAVEDIHKIQYSLPHLQRILTVYPLAFALKWTKARGRNNYNLHIDFPEDLEKSEGQLTQQLITKRKEEFKESLLEITKKHHDGFLKTLPSRPNINPDRMKVWHHAFDLHNVPDIPEAALPDKPFEKIDSVTEFLKKSTARNLMVQSVLEEVSKNDEKMNNSQSVSNTPTPTKPKVIAGLSESVLAKIRAKEKAIEEEKMSMPDPETTAKKVRGERLIILSETLKAMYATHSTPSQFLIQLIKKLKNIQRFAQLKEMIELDIKELTELFPSWLTLVKTRSGEVLRMNKESNILLPRIKEDIERKYITCN